MLNFNTTKNFTDSFAKFITPPRGKIERGGTSFLEFHDDTSEE